MNSSSLINTKPISTLGETSSQRHLVVSSQDLPHPHYFCTSTSIPARSIEDLENTYVYNSHSLQLKNTHTVPNPVFLYPTRLGPPSHLG